MFALVRCGSLLSLGSVIVVDCLLLVMMPLFVVVGGVV